MKSDYDEGIILHYPFFQDKYILTSMSILCLVCVWHAVVPLLVDGDDDDEAVLADRIALGVLSAVYVFFHLFFFLWIYFSVSIIPKPVFVKREQINDIRLKKKMLGFQ